MAKQRKPTSAGLKAGKFFIPLYCAFSVNAGKDFLYAQREGLVNAALANLPETRTERPTMYIRALEHPAVPGEVSALWFRERRPDETDEQAEELVEHGLCDLRITFEALAESRTLVTVECLGPALVPAAQAILRELARRYPEASDAIQPYLGRAKASRLPQPGREPTKNVRLPWRPKDRNRWRLIWVAIKAQWRKGKNYEDICNWLKKMHPDLKACHPDTLRDIIAAGEAGLLDVLDAQDAPGQPTSQPQTYSQPGPKSASPKIPPIFATKFRKGGDIT